MANKLTKKDKWMMILAIEAVKANPVLVEFANKELDLLERKNKGRKKTAQQMETEEIGEKVLEVLTNADSGMTATQIMLAVQPMFPKITLTPQRISAILRLLGEGEKGTGDVTKYVEKRVTYFKLAQEEEEEEEDPIFDDEGEIVEEG